MFFIPPADVIKVINENTQFYSGNNRNVLFKCHKKIDSNQDVSQETIETTLDQLLIFPKSISKLISEYTTTVEKEIENKYYSGKCCICL